MTVFFGKMTVLFGKKHCLLWKMTVSFGKFVFLEIMVEPFSLCKLSGKALANDVSQLMDLAKLDWAEVENVSKRESRQQKCEEITLEYKRKMNDWEKEKNKLL